MKKIFPLLFLVVFLFQSCGDESKNNLENSLWKSCGETSMIDVLDFRKDKKFLKVKNDTIYSIQNDSAMFVIDTITYHYGERRIYIKDFKNNRARFCEQ